MSPTGITRHFRGGGITDKTTSNYLRGDWVETDIVDTENGVTTSRLMRIICAVQVHNFKNVTGHIPGAEMYQTDENRKTDTMHFLLGRYGGPHPHTRRNRGPRHRPLCPGPLQNTHCLWEWYKKPRGFRRGCLLGRPWDENRHLFGETEELQLQRKQQESLAWYDLIQTRDIVHYANVQRDPDREDAFLQSVIWH